MSIILFNKDELIDPANDDCMLGGSAKNIINKDFSKINFISQLRNYTFSIFGINIVLGTYNQIVLAFLAAPFFILFGTSIFALKLMGLFISLSAFTIIYIIIEKIFNLRVAVVTAILFIFAPYSYTTNSLKAVTYNFDVFLFSILIIFFLFKVAFNKNNYIRNVIFLGFLLGFAFLSNPINLILIVTCLIFLLIFNKKFFASKYILIFIIFFIIAVSPEIIYNYEFAMGNIIPNSGVGGISLTNIKEVVLYDIPASFNFGNFGPIKGVIFNYTYYIIFVISFFFVLFDSKGIINSNLKIKVKNCKKKEFFFLLYPPLFIFFSLFNLLGVEYPIHAHSHRHILPLYLFIFIIIALFIVKLWYRDKKIISIVLMLIIIFLGINVKSNLISFDNSRQIYSATCDSLLASDYPLFTMGYTDNITFISEGCDQFKERLKLDCYTGLGLRVYQKYEGDLNLSFKECNNFKNNSSNACIYGLINSVGYEYVLNPSLDIFIMKCNKFDEESQKRCYFRLGQSIGSHFQKNKSLALKECKKIKSNSRYDCINGAFGTI